MEKSMSKKVTPYSLAGTGLRHSHSNEVMYKTIPEMLEYVSPSKGMSTKAGVEVSLMSISAFPENGFVVKKIFFATVKVAEVKIDGEKHYAMVSTRRNEDGNPVVLIWCGDKDTWLKGEIDKATADVRLQQAVKEGAIKDSPSSHARAEEQMKRLFGMAAGAVHKTSCNFWGNYRKSGVLCEHTAALVDHMENNGGLQKHIDELLVAYDDFVNGTGEVAAGDDYSLIKEVITQVPVLLEGDRGSGKTFLARKLAKELGRTLVTVGGHEGIEASDLQGRMTIGKGGQWKWQDGPISRAARLAASGEKVVLLMDELLRIPQRQLSILLTFLSPDEGCYVWETGKDTGEDADLASMEEIRVPVENIAVMGTTNVGTEFAIDECDPALAERFVVLGMDTDKKTLAKILSDQVIAKGWPKVKAERLVKFYEAMVKACDQSQMDKHPTVRTLSRAVALARDENDLKEKLIRLHIRLWTHRDSKGKPVAEQVQLATTLADKANV